MRDGVGLTAAMTQLQTLEFHRLHIPSPLLILVERGAKKVRLETGQTLDAVEGGLIVLPGQQMADIANTPDAAGAYRAHWLAFAPEVLALARPGGDSRPVGDMACVRTDAGFRGALHAAMDAIGDTAISDTIARHRLAEVLLWLGAAGWHFAPAAPPSLSERLRRHISMDPARGWSVEDLCGLAAQSEASLRRQLHREGLTPAGLVTDVRMLMALDRLQTTRHSIEHIATEVGYESGSRFARRFRERFGFAPSCVRGHKR